MEAGKVFRNVVLPVLATGAAIGGGVAIADGGGSNPNRSAAPATTLSPDQINGLIDQDCAQPQLSLEAYPSLLPGNSIVEPFSSTPGTGNSGETFSNQNETEVSEEVAQHVSRNTAALAIIWTILNQAETNITVVDASENATSTLTSIYNDPAKRGQVCQAVVRAIIESPPPADKWPYSYQSSTGNIFTYEPSYGTDQSGQQALEGINSQTSSDTGPIPGFVIAPVAGTGNQALQQAISSEWVLTPGGQIVQTEYNLGNEKIANSGKPVKATTHGNAPVTKPNQSNQQSSQSNTSGTSVSGGFTTTGAGGSSSAGKSPQNRQGFAPNGKPEGKPNKNHNSPAGGSGGSNHNQSSTTTTTTGGGSTGRGGNTFTSTVSTGGNTTTTQTTPGTTSTQETTTTNTTTTETTGTTGTTTTTSTGKGPAPTCTTNDPFCVN